MGATVGRMIDRLAGLPRLRAAAIVALASLSVGAVSRTDQVGAALVSWLASWAVVAFFAGYVALLLCALLADDRRQPGSAGYGATGAKGATKDRRRR
jgi:hypothetical protein